jgi:hypothetical protein
MEDITLSAFWVGLTSYNVGVTFINGHVENNSTAFVIGQDPTGAISTSGAHIIGAQFERDNTDFDVKLCGGCLFSGNTMTGVVGAAVPSNAPGGQYTGNTHSGTNIIDGMNSTAGLAINNGFTCGTCGTNTLITSVDSQVQVHVSVVSTGNATGTALTISPNTVYAGMINEAGFEGALIAGNNCGMAASHACWDLGSGGGTSVVFTGNLTSVSGTGPAWIMPTSSRSSYTFCGNDSPWNNCLGGSVPIAQANLPSCASDTDGWAISIKDAASPTYNSPIGSGSSRVIAFCINGTGWVAH